MAEHDHADAAGHDHGHDHDHDHGEAGGHRHSHDPDIVLTLLTCLGLAVAVVDRFLWPLPVYVPEAGLVLGFAAGGVPAGWVRAGGCKGLRPTRRTSAASQTACDEQGCGCENFYIK